MDTVRFRPVGDATLRPRASVPAQQGLSGKKHPENLLPWSSLYPLYAVFNNQNFKIDDSLKYPVIANETRGAAR